MKPSSAFYVACFVSLLGMTSALLSNKEPCKKDSDCDDAKFLRCSKLDYETSTKCLCKQGLVWQGGPECRVRDGGTCDPAAAWDMGKPLCMDGYDCSKGFDDATQKETHLCVRNPKGGKNVRGPKPKGKDATPSTKEGSDPDAAQASKWKEENPESVDAIKQTGLNETDSNTKPVNETETETSEREPPELNEDSEKQLGMGRSIGLGRGIMKPRKADEDDTAAAAPAEPPADDDDDSKGAAPDTSAEASTPGAVPAAAPGAVAGPAPAPTPAAPAPQSPSGAPATAAQAYDPSATGGPCAGVIQTGKDSLRTGVPDEKAKACFEYMYNFASPKTLSSGVAILVLMAGTLIV